MKIIIKKIIIKIIIIKIIIVKVIIINFGDVFVAFNDYIILSLVSSRL